MTSISHRTSLGQATPHRAEFGSTELPTGFPERFVRGVTRGLIGWLIQWRDDWRALRRIGTPDDHRLAGHLLRDVGLADAHDSTIALAHRDRHGQDPKGMPTWPTIS
jgi:hypothetical protein